MRFSERVWVVVVAIVALIMVGCTDSGVHEGFEPSTLIRVDAPQRPLENGEGHVFEVIDEFLWVAYDERLDPGSFRAHLNGVEVTDAFTLQPGMKDRVQLPGLEHGLHQLVFEVAPQQPEGVEVETRPVSAQVMRVERSESVTPPSLMNFTVSGPPSSPPVEQ